MTINTLTDAMLMRKAVALRDGMKTNHLNHMWVEQMLQRIVDNDHSADFLHRSVWATIARPKLPTIEEILDRKNDTHQCGMEETLAILLDAINWNEGPDEVDLTIVTMKNVFLDRDLVEETEGRIIEHATQHEGLEMCPDWVVAGICVHAEKVCPPPEAEKNHLHLNLCLVGDENRGSGFGMFFRQKWFMYRRAIGRNTSWYGPINWLFVKPRKAPEKK